MTNKSPILEAKGKNIVIAMHKKPDGDALASASVLVKYFEKVYPNKKCYIVADCPFIVRFPKIFNNFKNIIKGSEIPEESSLFVVDHNDREVSILYDWTNSNIKEIIIIDHHYEISTNFAEKPLRKEPIKYIDQSKLSTCELLFDHLKTLDWFEITQEIATYLYVGIFSDSLNFSTPFKRNLLAKVWELVDKYKVDIDGNAIYCYGKALYYLKITAYCWKSVRQDKGSNIATCFLSKTQYNLIKNSHITPVHICQDLLKARGIHYVVCAYEFAEGRWAIRVGSRRPGAIKGILPSAHHDDVHNLFNMTNERCKMYVATLVKSMKEWDSRYPEEKEFNSEGTNGEQLSS